MLMKGNTTEKVRVGKDFQFVPRESPLVLQKRKLKQTWSFARLILQYSDEYSGPELLTLFSQFAS